MHLKTHLAWVLLYGYAGFAWASIPEIDGALSIQAIGLLTGVLFLMKRKK